MRLYIWYRRNAGEEKKENKKRRTPYKLIHEYRNRNEHPDKRAILITPTFRFPISYLHNLLYSVTVVMHKDKEENSHHDSHYRAREMALAAYDHHHLDGEMFLQVSTRRGTLIT